MISVIPLYAALLGLIYIYLSVATLTRRKKILVALGDGGDGKDDRLTTRGDRSSIHTVEEPYNNTYHAQRDGSR